MITNSTGNALNEYADEVAAHLALRNIVEDEPAAADHLAIVAYDDNGMPFGDAVMFADLPLSTTLVLETRWTMLTRTCAFGLDVNEYRPTPRLGRLDPTSITAPTSTA